MENLVSVATENFLKTIYSLDNSEGKNTRPGSVARQLGITNAAATDMARKLSARNLVDYTKYRELKLTPEGEKMALGVIRKHRLWETFLHRVFGLTMHEIHREAEQLEHFTSDFMTEKLSLFLGHPTTDPHGDPIPDASGIIGSAHAETLPLSQAAEGENYKVTRLQGSDEEYFDFCHQNNIKINTVIRILNRYPNNRMTEVAVKNRKLLLHEDLASTIAVSKIKEKHAVHHNQKLS